MTTQVKIRSSRVALKAKDLEGELVQPSSGKEFLAIQTDFSLTPNFESVENLEIKDDIMSGQPTISGENPSGTLSHYFKGSGDPGVAPNFSALLKSTFGAEKVVSGVTTLASSSTTTVLKAANNNDAAKFSKGDMILIRDDANGYAIRPVLKTSGTDITLAYALSKAPANKVKIGKLVTYSPKSIDLPVFDCWHYLGGGTDGLETIRNCRTVSMSISASAKENINCSYSFEGTDYGLNTTKYATGILIGPNSDDLTFTYDSANDAGAKSAMITLEHKAYTKAQLAAEVQKKMRAVTDTGYDFAELVCTYDSSTDKYEFDTSAAPSGAKLDSLGFTYATSDKSLYMDILGLGTADIEATAISASSKLVAPHTAGGNDWDPGIESDFDETRPVIARDQVLFIGDQMDNVCVEAPSVTIDISTPKTLLTSICQESGNFATVINQRTATMSVSSFLQRDDKRYFEKFKQGDKTSFAFIGGLKSGGNWKVGEAFGVYGSEATITNFNLEQVEDVYSLSMELTCFSPGDGTGSIFCSFV